MKIEVLRNVLQKNEWAAEENRACFDERGVTCVNLLGGAGCGKTSLLEATLPTLKENLRVAVLEGDLATTRDAERIAALDVPVVQLLTDGGCHLNATLVQQALKQIPLDELDLLVIENVGNPICPANFDLGEHRRVVVLSVAEGDDKPAKYPLLFKDADLIVLTKCDLLPYVKFDVERARADLARVNPRAEIVRTDTNTATGIDRLAAWLSATARPQASA
ncbi:MAG: hydrogenase nickel incorporation protein HypB [Planctomycetes bacterium]|nr:hydrogenase nickel incorporation protein HypB [Planctomycetota bacterium]